MRSPRWFVIVMAMAMATAAACGGDGGGSSPDAPAPDAPLPDAPLPGACGSTGNGTVTGSVGGATLAPIARAFRVTAGGAGVAIVLDEAAGACGQQVASGEHLVLGFCAAPTAGAYTVVGEQQFSCPGPNAFGLIEQNGSTDFAESTGGTITITGVTATCVSGTFDLSMRPVSGPSTVASISGSFNAVICP